MLDARSSTTSPGARTPMKILLVTPRWTRDGGVSAHLVASAGALADNGFEVHVAAARIEPGGEVSGVTVHVSPELFNARLPPDLRLGEALSVGPSIVHLHQVDDPEVVDSLQAKAPVVISAHGYTACTSGVHYFRPGQECTRPHGAGCVPNLALRGCAHTRHIRPLPSSYKRAGAGVAALRRADLAVSYSSAVDRHLAVNDVTRRSIVPYFPTTTPNTVARPADRLVVFGGRVVAGKGVGVLIRAARAVEADFVICGDGRQLDAMRRLADRLGVADRVRFTGWLSPDDLATEFAQASVVALPSVWPEPFGLVGIEALAAGRPVVASLTGGIGDWLQDGIGGLCVEPGNVGALAQALSELLADPARQSAMGAAGRDAAAKRFSREKHVSALVEAYRTARTTWEGRRGESFTGPLAGPARAEPSQV
jgi:glycosyltransferase involved in cell wall biosynthesis